MTDQTPAVPMRMALKIAVSAYIGGMNLLLICSLIRLWPGPGHESQEVRYLLTTALAGALGSFIHLATSFVDYAGNKNLSESWAWWYFLRPGIGSALAVVVYFVVRAGLISPGETSLNPYGVAAVAALSGMFSKQATDKLQETFESLCATKKMKESSSLEQRDVPTSRP